MLENIGIMDHPFGTYAKFSKKTNISLGGGGGGGGGGGMYYVDDV